MLVEDFAGRRQVDPARRSLEQANPETALEFADLLANLRTGAVQTARRSGHAAGFDDLDEG
jgi:hypothetical protein